MSNHDQRPPHNQDQDQHRHLTLDLDRPLLRAALLESAMIHDQLLSLRLEPQVHSLVRQSRLRLIYFFSHSGLARECQRRGEILSLAAAAPHLAQALTDQQSRVQALCRNQDPA